MVIKSSISKYFQVGAIILILLFIYFQFQRTQKTKELEQKGKYTTGINIGWGKNYRSSDYNIDYEYNINYHHYRTTMNINSLDGVNVSGGKYIVVFVSDQPSKSRILVDKPVKSYEYPPIEGWTTIPDSVLINNK